MTLRHRSIAARLFMLVALVVLVCAAMVAIAVTASRQLGQAGAGLYRGVQGVSQAARIETLWERARALTARAPAELDLPTQQAFHARFHDAVQVISETLTTQRADADPALAELVAALRANIALAEHAAEQVFRLSASFAQEQAVAVLNNEFAAAEGRVNASLAQWSALQRAAAERDLVRLNKTRQEMGWLIGLTSALAVIVTAAFGTSLSRGISRRVFALTGAMRELAAGDMTVVIPFGQDQDELGEMARAAEVFKENAMQRERLAAERRSARAARERRQALVERLIGSFGASVSTTMAALSRSTDTMSRAVGTMSKAATDAHQQATGTADQARLSSHELTTIAAATEQMTASVDEISRQVLAAAEVSRAALDRAHAHHEVMQSLANAASRIGDTIGTIGGIAGQTNLLALNATIEAARAGDAGRGFAVVAGEVKLLAQQTAKATVDIEAQITAVRGGAKTAVEAMAEIGAIIGRIDAVTTAISAAMEQQSSATRQIASHVQVVTGATQASAAAMSKVVEVADLAGQTSRAVLTGVGEIEREARSLQTEIDRFLEAVRDDSGAGEASRELAAAAG